MKKDRLLLAGLLISALMSAGQSGYQKGTYLFDDGWKFHMGNAAYPEKDFNFRIANIFSKSGRAENTAIDPGFNDDDWSGIQIPHDWAVELPFANSPNSDVMSHGYKPVGGLFPETSIGWYRKHFTVSRTDTGKHFSIRFDGVFRDAKFWINGFYLGSNESGYMGTSFDLTDFINFDADNVLVVRVDASQYEGWFYEGAGIYRHVWFREFNAMHIPEQGVFVYADVKDRSALVTIEASVKNLKNTTSEGTLSSFIIDRNGKKIASSGDQHILVPALGTKKIKQQVSIINPVLWSLKDPFLYREVSVLRMDGRVTDSTVTRFGLRTLRFDPENGFFLNGENLKIHGVCCHQDHAGVGVAVPDDLVYYRLRLLKEMGVNAYRTSHNPPAPELLDACDSLGILVMDETRLLNSGKEYLQQFENLILRDRNHPCIFLWSIGNEEGYIQRTEVGRRIAETFITRQHVLDSSRTCTYAADMANEFKGINEVIPVRGFNYRQSSVADYHKSHPLQPIIGTEMGSTVTTRGIYSKDTVNCYVPDQDITAPWWASKAEDWWRLCSGQPWWMGGFVWTGFDYRGEPTPYRWPNINSHFGIMDVCGFPKNIYYYYQSWWTDKDVVHISPHWNWHGQEGKPVKVWVNSNADNVELFLNGKSLGKQVMSRNSHLEWDVPYQPGIVSAIGYKNGRKLSTRVETTGEAVKIILTPNLEKFTPNGRDIQVINVSVVDSKDHEVPDARNLIHFKITGDAAIIGVGNGDPSSHEADKCQPGSWQRSLFNGKCQVLVQSGKSAGTISFEAESEGLISGSIVLMNPK